MECKVKRAVRAERSAAVVSRPSAAAAQDSAAEPQDAAAEAAEAKAPNTGGFTALVDFPVEEQRELLLSHEVVRPPAFDTLADAEHLLGERLQHIHAEAATIVVDWPPTGQRHVIRRGPLRIVPPAAPRPRASKGSTISREPTERLQPFEAEVRRLDYTITQLHDHSYQVYTVRGAAPCTDGLDPEEAAATVAAATAATEAAYPDPLPAGWLRTEESEVLEPLGPPQILREVPFGTMFIPVGCSLCNQFRFDGRHTAADGTPTGPPSMVPPGVYIKSGQRKVPRPQKEKRANVFHMRGDPFGPIHLQLRCTRTDERYRHSSTLEAFLVPTTAGSGKGGGAKGFAGAGGGGGGADGAESIAGSGAGTGAGGSIMTGDIPAMISILIPYLFTPPVNASKGLPIIAVFRLLGFHTLAEILTYVFPRHDGRAAAPRGADEDFLDDEDEDANVGCGLGIEAVRLFEANFLHPLATAPMPDVYAAACRGITVDAGREVWQTDLQVHGELLPHVMGHWDDPATVRRKKALVLGAMCRRMLGRYLGLERAEHEDAVFMKSLEMASILLGRHARTRVVQYNTQVRLGMLQNLAKASGVALSDVLRRGGRRKTAPPLRRPQDVAAVWGAGFDTVSTADVGGAAAAAAAAADDIAVDVGLAALIRGAVGFLGHPDDDALLDGFHKSGFRTSGFCTTSSDSSGGGGAAAGPQDLLAITSGVNVFSNGVASAFSDGQVVIRKKASNSGTPVIQFVASANTLAHQQELRRFVTGMSKEGRYTKARNVSDLDPLTICPLTTPEGTSVGLVQEAALLMEVRQPVHMEQTVRTLRRLGAYAAGTMAGRGLPPGVTAHDLPPAATTVSDWFATPAFVRAFDTPADLAIRSSSADAARGGGPALVYLNGDPIAVTDFACAFRAVACSARRNGALQPHNAGVIWRRDLLPQEVHIRTDMGQPTFPLFNASNWGRRAAGRALAQADGAMELWDAYMRVGALEYMEPEELMQDMRFAFCTADVEDWVKVVARGGPDAAAQAAQPYTHLVPHPMAQFSRPAACVPFANWAQPTRQGVSATMEKQVIESPGLDYPWNPSINYGRALLNPQAPLVATDVARLPCFAETGGGGQVLFVAITAAHDGREGGGGTIEDALLVNKASVERGMLATLFTRSYADAAPRRGRRPMATGPDGVGLPTVEGGHNRVAAAVADEGHNFCNPRLVGASHLRAGVDYSALDERGLPNPGDIVGNGSVLMGKAVAVLETEPGRGGSGVGGGNDKDKDGAVCRLGRRDASTVLRCHPASKFRVHKVAVSTTAAGHPLHRISLHSLRPLALGNKARTQHGQKFTVQRLVGQESMPVVMFGPPGLVGVTLDAVLSMACISTRGTDNLLLEGVLSLLCLEYGQFLDGTAFRALFSGDGCEATDGRAAAAALLRVMGERGLCPRVWLQNPITGTLYKEPVCIMAINVAALCHQALDKFHVRRTGPLVPGTRLPTQGLSEEGGLRLGGMELDCIQEEGCEAVLKDRVHKGGDGERVLVCKACGRALTARQDALSAALLASGQGHLPQVQPPYCGACKSTALRQVESTWGYMARFQPQAAMLGIGVRHTLVDTHNQAWMPAAADVPVPLLVPAAHDGDEAAGALLGEAASRAAGALEAAWQTPLHSRVRAAADADLARTRAMLAAGGELSGQDAQRDAQLDAQLTAQTASTARNCSAKTAAEDDEGEDGAARFGSSSNYGKGSFGRSKAVWTIAPDSSAKVAGTVAGTVTGSKRKRSMVRFAPSPPRSESPPFEQTCQ